MGSARAEDKEKAREAYRRATQHYDLGEYQQALDNFKEAYRNFEEPSFLFNIAQCHRQLGDSRSAVRFYRMYLIKVPDASNGDAVRDLILKLDKTIENAPPPKPVDKPATIIPPTATTLTQAPTVTPKRTRPTPVYRRWWFWTVVGGVAAGAGVGLGVGLTASSPKYPTGSLPALTY